MTSVQKLSELSDSDRALFKTATEADRVVVTAETVFYAQGGGQPSDTGVMHPSPSPSSPSSTFTVSAVRSGSGGRILHLGRFSPEEGAEFAVGDTVQQTIDGAARDLHSRIHTAGHIIGLAVRRLCTGDAPSMPAVEELKAQHYPDAAFVEFKGIIEGKHKDAIQEQAQKFVDQALPIKVYWWDEQELREKCAMVPENVAMPKGEGEEEEKVRAVDIVGAGAYPCGGTHVKDTSFVGKVTVRKIGRSKGISKVSYQIS